MKTANAYNTRKGKTICGQYVSLGPTGLICLKLGLSNLKIDLLVIAAYADGTSTF